jgi:hypothetical protein
MWAFLSELVNYTNAQQSATGIDAQLPGCQLLRDPAVSELLLQQLAAYTGVLHNDHVARRQEQRQQQRATAAGGSSSSSSSSNQLQQRSAQGAKQQHRADLVDIPAFHQHTDVLQLLPGGQAYLDAAAARVWNQQHLGTTTQLWPRIFHQLQVVQVSVIASLASTLEEQHSGQAVDAAAPLMSAAAVRLVLQLQLLAASFVQRQRATKQQQQQEVELLQDPQALLLRTNYLLQVQIRAVLQCTRSSSLQPEVLQQAGLQLLQALAAPLQQLQLCSPDDRLPSLVVDWDNVGDRLAQQQFALQAAAGGISQPMASTTSKPTVAAVTATVLLM